MKIEFVNSVMKELNLKLAFVFFSGPLSSVDRGLWNKLLVSKYKDWYDLDAQDKLKILMKRENVVFFRKLSKKTILFWG